MGKRRALTLYLLNSSSLDWSGSLGIFWTSSEVRQDWKDATIEVLYEKDRTECGNCRAIFFAAHAHEGFLKIIAHRLGSFCEGRSLPGKTVGSPAPTIEHRHDVRGTPDTEVASNIP